jgi:type I restriction enzyme, R subunit
MSKPSEHKTVQARILAYAQEIGRTFVPREEAERRRAMNHKERREHKEDLDSESLSSLCSLRLFFEDPLHAQVLEFNPRYAEAEGALSGKFRHLHTDIYGNREFVEHLRNRGKFFDHEEKRERDLILIDYEDTSVPISPVFRWRDATQEVLDTVTMG